MGGRKGRSEGGRVVKTVFQIGELYIYCRW